MRGRTFYLFLSLLAVTCMLLIAQRNARAGMSPAATSERPLVTTTFHRTPPVINEIALEGDFVWLATVDGATRWNRSDDTQRTYYTRDGLAGDEVLTIMIEPDGVRWFGTADGLSRFDGASWTTYTTAHGLPSNHVRVVFRHPDGALYVGTAMGLVRYDGVRFTRLPRDGVDDYSPGPYGTSDILVQDDVLWIATSGAGTYRFDGNRWLPPLADPDVGPGGMVNEMALAPNGAVWFAFHGAFEQGSVGRMLDGVWTRYSRANGLISDDASAIAVGPAGQVYAGFGEVGTISGDAGVARFAGASWAPIFLDGAAGIPKNLPVADLKYDEDGTLWAAVDDMLLYFDGSTWRLHLLGPPTGMDTSHGIADHEGNMWFGVYGMGAVRFDGQRWRLFTGRDGMSGGSVQDVVVDAHGDLWFATSSMGVGTGVRRFDGATWYSYSYDSGLGSHIVSAIDADKAGNVWFATFEGLVRFDGASWRRFTAADGLLADRVWDVAAHDNGVWVTYFASDLGVSFYDGVAWRHYGAADGLAQDSVTLVTLDSGGNPWVTAGHYLSHFDAGVWTNHLYPGGNNHREIRSLYVDGQDTVWLSIYEDGYTGLTYFKDGAWATLTMADGLPTNAVYGVTPGVLSNSFWMDSDYNSGPRGVVETRLLFDLDQKEYLSLVSDF